MGRAVGTLSERCLAPYSCGTSVRKSTLEGRVWGWTRQSNLDKTPIGLSNYYHKLSDQYKMFKYCGSVAVPVRPAHSRVQESAIVNQCNKMWTMAIKCA